MIGTNRAAGISGSILLTLVTAISTAQAAIVVDLTREGAKGTINGAIYQQVDPQPTGTGVINTFLRIQAKGVEEGFNTDHRPVQFDEKTDIHTRSLLLTDVPQVTINGIPYREFLLDINETVPKSLLSLNDVQIFLESAPDLNVFSKLRNPVYKMDEGADNSVKLDYNLNHGSGSGDMLLYVPEANFAATSGAYVYLYSKFGQPIPGDSSSVGADQTADAGFEEWAAGKQGPGGTIVPITPVTPVPEPAALTSIALAAFGLMTRKRR